MPAPVAIPSRPQQRHEPQVAARHRRDRARVPDRLQDLHRFGFRRGHGGVRIGRGLGRYRRIDGVVW